MWDTGTELFPARDLLFHVRRDLFDVVSHQHHQCLFQNTLTMAFHHHLDLYDVESPRVGLVRSQWYFRFIFSHSRPTSPQFDYHWSNLAEGGRREVVSILEDLQRRSNLLSLGDLNEGCLAVLNREMVGVSFVLAVVRESVGHCLVGHLP